MLVHVRCMGRSVLCIIYVFVHTYMCIYVDCLNVIMVARPTGPGDRDRRFLQTVDLWPLAATPPSCLLTCLDVSSDIHLLDSRTWRGTRGPSRCSGLTISRYAVPKLAFVTLSGTMLSQWPAFASVATYARFYHFCLCRVAQLTTQNYGFNNTEEIKDNDILPYQLRRRALWV